MASIRVTFFVVAVVLLAIFHVGSGADPNCYKCDGLEQCKTNTSISKEPCSSGKVCIKIDNTKGETVYRRCDLKTGCDIYSYCTSCTGELCNSSSALVPSFLTFAIVTAVIAKFYF